MSCGVVALARLKWLLVCQAEEDPEDPLCWSHEAEWLEGVVLQDCGGMEVEGLRWFLSELGFRPLASRGHVLYLDYIYVDGQAVAVPWRSRLLARLRSRQEENGYVVPKPGAKCGCCGTELRHDGALRPGARRWVCGCTFL